MEAICHHIPLWEIQDIITTKVMFGGAERKHIPYVVRLVQHKQALIFIMSLAPSGVSYCCWPIWVTMAEELTYTARKIIILRCQ